MSDRYCSGCGFDLEECPDCGFTRDPDMQEVCPQCNADVPNDSLGMHLEYYSPIIMEPTQLELLEAFPSL